MTENTKRPPLKVLLLLLLPLPTRVSLSQHKYYPNRYHPYRTFIHSSDTVIEFCFLSSSCVCVCVYLWLHKFTIHSSSLARHTLREFTDKNTSVKKWHNYDRQRGRSRCCLSPPSLGSTANNNNNNDSRRLICISVPLSPTCWHRTPTTPTKLNAT